MSLHGELIDAIKAKDAHRTEASAPTCRLPLLGRVSAARKPADANPFAMLGRPRLTLDLSMGRSIRALRLAVPMA